MLLSGDLVLHSNNPLKPTALCELAKEGHARAAAIAFALIGAVIFTLFAGSYLISRLFGFPFSLHPPVVMKLIGAAIALTGISIMAWVFKTRRPTNVIVSTYYTFAKIFRRIPLAEAGGRTEPLIISGPQKYTRNPLYFGVVVMTFGLAVFGGFVFVFIATMIILLWFSLVLIPFEERELRVLFGEQWKRYAEETPMLIPFTKRRKHRGLPPVLP